LRTALAQLARPGAAVRRHHAGELVGVLGEPRDGWPDDFAGDRVAALLLEVLQDASEELGVRSAGDAERGALRRHATDQLLRRRQLRVAAASSSCTAQLVGDLAGARRQIPVWVGEDALDQRRLVVRVRQDRRDSRPLADPRVVDLLEALAEQRDAVLVRGRAELQHVLHRRLLLRVETLEQLVDPVDSTLPAVRQQLDPGHRLLAAQVACDPAGVATHARQLAHGPAGDTRRLRHHLALTGPQRGKPLLSRALPCDKPPTGPEVMPGTLDRPLIRAAAGPVERTLPEADEQVAAGLLRLHAALAAREPQSGPAGRLHVRLRVTDLRLQAGRLPGVALKLRHVVACLQGREPSRVPWRSSGAVRCVGELGERLGGAVTVSDARECRRGTSRGPTAGEHRRGAAGGDAERRGVEHERREAVVALDLPAELGGVVEDRPVAALVVLRDGVERLRHALLEPVLLDLGDDALDALRDAGDRLDRCPQAALGDRGRMLDRGAAKLDRHVRDVEQRRARVIGICVCSSRNRPTDAGTSEL
jgi:hypothetical protein